jgi:hypothetical protein
MAGVFRDLLHFHQHDNGADLPPGAEALEFTLKRTMAEP